MLRQIRWKIWAVICAAVIILAIVYYYGVIQENIGGAPAVYSVVLYQHTDNEWDTLMEGVDQAEDDFNVKIRYATLGERDSVQDQLQIIEREALAGASGILVAASDSAALAQGLEGLKLQIPVLTVETGAGELANISADNYEMGRELGKKIVADRERIKSGGRVTVIQEFMERDSVRLRYEGLRDALLEAGEDMEIHNISRQSGDLNLQFFVEDMLSESGDYIVALDKFCTEQAAAAWAAVRSVYENERRHIKVYGIGNTAQTVNDLDNGRLQALVYQNEFNMGYEGIRALTEKEQKAFSAGGCDIRFKLVTGESLYEPENERLLFSSI